MAGGGGDYARKRIIYEDVSGSLLVATSTDDTTLIADKANYTVHIQKIHMQTSTTNAATWTFQDGAGTVIINGAVNTALAHQDFDWGPEGLTLATGKGLVLNVSATGAGGSITWEAYRTRDNGVAV